MEIPGTLKDLELRIRTLLPEQYQETYETVQPVSMGSAGLQYGRDGEVAWDEIWDSFCDLAMAGGPPHKGTLLEPGLPAAIEAEGQRYAEVTKEICRGIELVSTLAARCSAIPGWVAVECLDETTAGWLARAIIMENISTFHEGTVLYLPAGPGYRIEKEIKNVITSIAKTSHYWLDHTWLSEQRAIGELFSRMSEAMALLQPPSPGQDAGQEQEEPLRVAIQNEIGLMTPLRACARSYSGWCGLDCPDVRTAIWIMRGLVACNAFARREGTTLFVPVNPLSDPQGKRIAHLTIEIWRHSRAGVAAA